MEQHLPSRLHIEGSKIGPYNGLLRTSTELNAGAKIEPNEAALVGPFLIVELDSYPIAG